MDGDSLGDIVRAEARAKERLRVYLARLAAEKVTSAVRRDVLDELRGLATAAVAATRPGKRARGRRGARDVGRDDAAAGAGGEVNRLLRESPAFAAAARRVCESGAPCEEGAAGAFHASLRRAVEEYMQELAHS